MKSNNEIMDIACRTDVLTDELFQDLSERSSYGSMGALNWAISVLRVLRDRINSNQKIWYHDEILTNEGFQTIVEKEFSVYVVQKLFVPRSHLNKRTYFKLENTEQGMDLVYTGEKENDLFQWIADINGFESLVRIIPTNVVYIYNSKTKDYTPFLTEHNSCYVYDEEDGKIKEYFE